VDPAELSPGEFVSVIRSAVEGKDQNAQPAKVVLIDSLNGYLHSMPDEQYLNAQLHELFTYLNHRGINTLVTLTQQGMIGNMTTPVDTTYLADNVILFRYFEALGEIRRAISVLKKRSGAHETVIREMRFGSTGLELGEPLTQFQGVLTGTPSFLGTAGDLMSGPPRKPKGDL
jgi:circadian clock protein KaiC